MSNRWEHELQQCLDTDIDFPVAEFIKLHSEVPQRTIRRRHAQLRATLMKRLQKRAALGIQAVTVASLNTPASQAAKGSCGGKKNTAESQAAKGSSGGKKNTTRSQAAKGSSGGKKNTSESQADKGKKNTAESQAAKGSSGGKKNTAESQADKGKKNTAESQAAKGASGGKKNATESQAAKGSSGGKKNTAESQAAKGSSGGKKNTAESQANKGKKNTPESQRDKGIVGGHGNTPKKLHIKASGRRCCGVVRTVSRELFRVNPSSPSNISLKSVREYWLDGLDTLYSPLFDALCYRCGQLLWGPIGGGHKFTVPRNTDEIRTQTLFGVPPTDLVTSGIFSFRNEMFANYLKYKNAPFPVPPRSPAPSTSRFVVYDIPVLHSATRMYACHVCSKYSAKYDPINFGYTLDGDIHYNIPSKIADLTKYQKQQIALGALYSNTLKHVDLRHKQWHHAIGTVGPLDQQWVKKWVKNAFFQK